MDLPIKHGDFPCFFVCLPEGNIGLHASYKLCQFLCSVKIFCRSGLHLHLVNRRWQIISFPVYKNQWPGSRNRLVASIDMVLFRILISHWKNHAPIVLHTKYLRKWQRLSRQEVRDHGHQSARCQQVLANVVKPRAHRTECDDWCEIACKQYNCVIGYTV